MSVSHYHPLHSSAPLKESSDLSPDGAPAARSRFKTFKAWVNTAWPLFLHSIIATAISLILISCVDDVHFGRLTDRHPVAPLPDGRSLTSTPFVLLQSDVVTALSAAIVFLRWVLAAWSTPFCWRSALFLMGRRGLTRQELKSMLGSSVPMPNLSRWGHHEALLISTALLLNLIASSVSPLLTGAISWIPSNRPFALGPRAHQLSVSYMNASDAGYWSTHYMKDQVFRRSVLQKALGCTTLAWGRELEKNVLKRTIPSAEGLEINSTLAGVTLPYFAVNRIGWTTLDDKTANDTIRELVRVVNLGPMTKDDFWLMAGSVGIIPPAPWSDSNKSFPSPVVVNRTGRLLLNLGDWKSKDSPGTSVRFSAHPPFYAFGAWAYAFADIDYTVGVFQCSLCNVSSPSTIQYTGPLQIPPKPDAMTQEALSLVPAVASTLVTMNSSIPFPWNNTVDDYVTALLVRSYSAAWTALYERVGRPMIPVSYSAAIPALQAKVDRVRVYAWLGFQLLVTLSGLLFLIMIKSEDNLLGDMTLTGFYLDTTNVPISGRAPAFKRGGVLRLRSKEERLKVDVQSD
ncbi:hypothetical protein FRC11_012679 [Ceratobasidium sp. 423]|nr:hypothetical protein FRC11_012679 [Ceratobasidium sp. 423]